MWEIVVRPETQDDVKAIEVVNLAAFEGESEAQLVEALRQSPGYVPELARVAEFNGRIVGHIMLTRVKLVRDGNEQEILALGPMSVVPSQSHRGIGTQLVGAAIQAAGTLGFSAIVEAGQPNFYEHQGFAPIANWGLSCSLPVSGEVITAIELQDGALNGGGHIVYPEAFNAIFA